MMWRSDGHTVLSSLEPSFNTALMVLAGVIAVVLLIGSVTFALWRRKKKEEKEKAYRGKFDDANQQLCTKEEPELAP